MKTDATVHIIDDNDEILDALQWLVVSIGYKVKTYSNPLSFLESYEPQHPQCLVSDMRMPRMSGLELQEHLNSNNIRIPTIFISGHSDIPCAVRAMKMGAIDFFTKPVNNTMLLEAINKAIRKDAQKTEQELKRHAVTLLLDTLTDRENGVIPLMLNGQSSKMIAKQLTISPSTVEIHRSNIMKKMKVKSLVELSQLVNHSSET